MVAVSIGCSLGTQSNKSTQTTLTSSTPGLRNSTAVLILMSQFRSKDDTVEVKMMCVREGGERIGELGEIDPCGFF